MIVVTGGAGFIGSCLLSYLRKKGAGPLVAVDDFGKKEKEKNWKGIDRLLRVDRQNFFQWVKKSGSEIEFVFHLGARTDTSETDEAIFNELNLEFSKKMWEFCASKSIPLVYASSAATYGNAEHGFSDQSDIIPQLKPLNAYAQSKQDFDLWAMDQDLAPPSWYWLKFFNVYGPNEYHKGKMSSIIFHAYNQILKTDQVKLFRSHREDIEHGEQKRDFIYVKDVLSVLFFFYTKEPNSGIYNLGTGHARSFLDLSKSVFETLKKEPQIEFIDTPENLRPNYQYFTEARMNKLRDAGYHHPFYSLEGGVSDYIREYLIPAKYF